VSWTAAEYVLPDEPFTGVERPMLGGFLDRYRVSFLNRCSGLTAEQLAERSAPPSNLSLIGIARHLTDVELNYFRRRWGGQEIASYYASVERPDADFEDASPATAERDLQRLVAEQEAARQAVADMPLEEIFVNPRWGEMSLRWALIHMIGEYAGHTGQADLIRERIDGKAGWW
jgi:uncharacterized damage-inducible protein DinB